MGCKSCPFIVGTTILPGVPSIPIVGVKSCPRGGIVISGVNGIAVSKVI